MKAVGPIRQAITELETRLASHEAQRASWIAARQKALTEIDRYAQHEVDDAAAQIAHLDRHIGDARDRITALRNELPSPERVQRAEAEAMILGQRAAARQSRIGELSQRLFTILDEAEGIAVELMAERSRERQALAEMRDLGTTFGIAVVVPHADPQDRFSTQVSRLRVGLLEGAVDGAHEPDSVLTRDLNAAKASLAETSYSRRVAS